MALKTWLISLALRGKLPTWMYRLAGKKVAKILDLKETNMADEKEVIQKWKSKTVWVAIVTAIVAAVQPISTAFGHPIVIPDWVLQFLAGVGLYSLRTANTAVK